MDVVSRHTVENAKVEPMEPTDKYKAGKMLYTIYHELAQQTYPSALIRQEFDTLYLEPYKQLWEDAAQRFGKWVLAEYGD